MNRGQNTRSSKQAVQASDNKADLPPGEAKSCEQVVAETKTSFEHILFVSNKKLSKEITKKFPDIKAFDKEQFLNRDCAQMLGYGINYIWLDVTNKWSMSWFCQNVKTNTSYTVIVAYDYVNKAMKTSKFIADLENLEDGIHLFIKYRDLIGIKSLNMSDLVDKIKNYTKIHNPVSCWESILGLSPNLQKKSLP